MRPVPSAGLVSCGLSTGLLAAAGPALAESASVSANWAGYAVTGSAGSGHFSRVAGSWVQPAGKCHSGQETFSVAWVGLGGFTRGARALEQAGTAVDCARSGARLYSAWYELVPQAPVRLRLVVHPGDLIAASVAIKGPRTILQVRDLSTQVVRTVVRRKRLRDLSSAEWIEEAPSNCFSPHSCTPLPLTDFGAISFFKASVLLGERRYQAIDAPSLRVTELELRDYARVDQGPQAQAASAPASGVASPLSATGDAFTVTWQPLPDQEPTEEPPQQPPSGASSGALDGHRGVRA